MRCYQCNYSKLHMDEQYGMYGTGMGESEEPGTLWMPHPVHKDTDQLHAKGMFGQHRPIMYRSRVEADRIARKVGGHVSVYDMGAKHYIYRSRPLKEEYGAGEDGSTQAAVRYQHDTPGQEDAHMPYQKTIRTIKKFMRDKYKRKLV